jgi:hypothetical protein
MLDPIVADSALRKQLGELDQVIDVHDQTGKLIGRFVPVEIYRYLIKNLKLPISDEELARREKEGGGRPLKELWQELERSAS